MHTTRTFLALTLDQEPLRAVTRLISNLRYRVDGVRWIPSENLHITLAFLGDVVTEDLPSLCNAVKEVCSQQESYELGLRRMGAFPDLRRPRVLWVGVQRGLQESAELESALSDRIEPLGYRRENRAYVPHLTIGRVKGRLRWRGPQKEQLAELDSWDGGCSVIESVKVMSSELAPAGPTYRTVATCVLGRRN
ncbi:MAG: RNA 2',3'-cyclic phosphodiesterase [Planctomycetota bacterium]